ncbi:hypothetical protein C8N47_1039 [Mangrovibacterium marinum]|uniref:Uncharacterized protein n=1 Tax=Mangrovibacterium marinum TaxID=1639118 RepID=A0A2T5C4C3_9BACT|nr:hypothetical protein C8N47_1039 [Mangrovibacterium marinum]
MKLIFYARWKAMTAQSDRDWGISLSERAEMWSQVLILS